nr:hypothetical protein [Tanacetum cinerariifolium]
NSQRLDKKEQEVKNVEEQPAGRRNRAEKLLHNFRVIHKSSNSLKDTSQISSIHVVAPIQSTKEPEHSLSMGYEHPSITPEIESNEVTESNAENLLPIQSECEVTSEDERKYDMPAKDDCSPAFTTFSNPLFNNNDNLDSSDNELLPEEDVLADEFKDGDSQREEIDIVTDTDDVLPPSVENADDFEGEIDVVEELPRDNSIPLIEDEASDSDY